MTATPPPVTHDCSRVFDLMATACQRHCKAVEEAHKQHVAAIERLHRVQISNLQSKLRQMERERLANSKPCEERAALVDFLAGLRGFHINSKDGVLVIITHANYKLLIPITVSTQQTVLGLTATVNVELQKRRERHGVAK